MKGIIIALIVSVLIGVGVGYYFFRCGEVVIDKKPYDKIDSLLVEYNIVNDKLKLVLVQKDSINALLLKKMKEVNSPPVKVIYDEDSLINSLNSTLDAYNLY